MRHYGVYKNPLSNNRHCEAAKRPKQSLFKIASSAFLLRQGFVGQVGLLAMTALISLFISGYASAAQFGILSETYVYPDGLRLDTDSKLFVWNNTTTLSDDTTDKREGEKSLKGIVGNQGWFGFGIIWDPDNNNTADPKNMSAYSGGSLNFWVKTEVNLKVGIESTGPVQRWIALKNAPYSIPLDNQWRFVSIPFSSFSGIDFTQVKQLFMALSDGAVTAGKTYHFDNVRWNTENVGALDHINVSPASFIIPTGYTKNFIAKGYDANNRLRDIYPAWSSPDISGAFNVSQDGLECIFTPAPVPDSGTVRATEGAIYGSSNVQVQDVLWNDLFNIFIDKGVYGSLGAYDSDDGNGDGDGVENNSIALATVTDVHPTGLTKSLKATYSITATGWAGCFFQEGALTETASVRDLSNFSNGYIHLWVKTPVNLEMGLRTNNIASGAERSKVRLSEYGIPADNTWREVYIALDDFKNRDARIDFTQSKIFVNTAVVGRYIGASSNIFYLSDIKYVREKTVPLTLTVSIKRRADNQDEPLGRITYIAAQLNGGWEIADQYLYIGYDTGYLSWGAQIYTDNMGAGASPRYSGDPTNYPDQQPTGLIGVSERFLNCPMAWMALDDVNTNVPRPVEAGDGVYFDSDIGGTWGGTPALSEWSWLKDKMSTRWVDANTNDIVDPGEIVADFSLTGDAYSTFIETAGMATGWFNPDGARVYILNPQSPIVVYLAAKFTKASVLQEYKTNTLTLELYHY